MKWIIQRFEKWKAKRALRRVLKKELAYLKKLQSSKFINDHKITPEAEFTQSILAAKKIYQYCKNKKLNNKVQWDAAGIPMAFIMKTLMQKSVKYADVRQYDVDNMQRQYK